MLITQDQARSVVAKLIYISICGDSTKTASETAELKSHLISFLKSAARTRKRNKSDAGTNLSTWEIDTHFQDIIDLVELQYFHTLLLIRTGLDIDTLSPTEFKAIQGATNGKVFTTKLMQFGYANALFEGTGITDLTDQQREMKELYKKSRKAFTLKGTIAYIKKQGLNLVGGADPAEFVVDSILDVIVGETGEQVGDNYLKTLGLSTMRKVKSSRTLLSFFMNEASQSYAKRASLTTEEFGTKAGDWETFKAKTVADLKFAKRKIYDYTRKKMNQLKDISKPLLSMELEDGTSIYEQITDFNLGEGDAEAFLEEYRGKGLDSTKLRRIAKELKGKLEKNTINPSDVPNIFGSLFSREMSVNLIRYALDNIQSVSTDRKVQSAMREIAYKRIYALGGLTTREVGLLDSSLEGNKVVRGRARASMKKLVSRKLGLEDLRPMFGIIEKQIDTVDDDNGIYFFVDKDQYPVIPSDFWDKVVLPAEKLKSRFETLPLDISDKVGIGLQASLSEINGLFRLIIKKAKSLLPNGVSDDDFSFTVVANNINADHNLEYLKDLHDEIGKLLKTKKVQSHPLSSLSSLEYNEISTETRASSLHPGDLTNVRLNTFNKLKSAMLENEPYKSDMEDLEAYRLWVQSFSFPAMEAIQKIYTNKSMKGGKSGPSLELLQEFSTIVSEELQYRYDRKPSFNRGGDFGSLKDIVGDTTILTNFENALKDVVKNSEDPENIDRDQMIGLAEKFYDAYKELSDKFPATYTEGVKAISEKSDSEKSEYKDDFARLKKSIVREIAIEKLSPRSLRGAEKFPSQILKQRAKATAKLSTTTLNESQIIETVLGKDGGGPVMTEEEIKKEIDKGKKKWIKAVNQIESDSVKETLTSQVTSLLEQGDFLLPEARINATSLELLPKKKIMEAFQVYRDAIALDILTEYPEREALRARLEASDKGMEKREEANKLLDTLSKKNKAELTAGEQSELAQLKEEIHPLQEESARLLSGSKRAGEIARARARRERNEKKRRYSVKVDEIVRQTDLDIEVASQAKIREAEKTLNEKIIGETASSGSSLLRPTAKGDANKTIARGLASVANAKLLSDKNLASKVTSAILSVESEEVLNFLDSSPECFSGIDTNSEAQKSLLKAFVSSFKKIGRFYDGSANTSYTPNYKSPFEDSASGRITNYVTDFVSYIVACCSIEVAEQTARNYYEVDQGAVYIKESAKVWGLYKSLGFYEEARDYLESNVLSSSVSTLDTNTIKAASEGLRDHIKSLLESQLDIKIPGSYLNTKTISVEVSGGEGQEPKYSADFSIEIKDIKDRRDEVASNYKGFLNGLILLGGAYLKGGDDVLYESLGLDPDCGKAFATLVGLER